MVLLDDQLIGGLMAQVKSKAQDRQQKVFNLAIAKKTKFAIVKFCVIHFVNLIFVNLAIFIIDRCLIFGKLT